MQMYPTKVNRVKPVPSPIISLGNRVTKASFNKSGCNCGNKKYTHNKRSKIGFR
ncbi:hypothetical protein HXA34_13450 [Salipaludibacillus agaradhaerens]|uniref:hypothetical protein n=1 Tax=Salipaludibacillus agaradhaerens TaxID=76935 RepID=UPI0021514AFD|nr:hypothetical protein [Salipaludibacillus agaradhaerens]MCR6107305.1 hypothetical protein [Salipaludibacillus agaradhaerens]MCR6111355.1 hypothetical protein [Bacillus sp. A301a_S52]MCR6119334.1 hypothetical protein [Salipaludibacillus agaradhaerens]